ncbi:MAG: hypothetical protein WKG07_27195 [Hymenobacter sp.]
MPVRRKGRRPGPARRLSEQLASAAPETDYSARYHEAPADPRSEEVAAPPIARLPLPARAPRATPPGWPPAARSAPPRPAAKPATPAKPAAASTVKPLKPAAPKPPPTVAKSITPPPRLGQTHSAKAATHKASKASTKKPCATRLLPNPR